MTSDEPSIEELIERSSLGTAGARQLRARTSKDELAKIRKLRKLLSKQDSLKRAAQTGDSNAMLHLAMLLDHDLGEPLQARTWYEKAAQQGDITAMIELGSLLANRYPQPDEAAARAWLLKAAEAADDAGMIHLGDGPVRIDPAQLSDGDAEPLKTGSTASNANPTLIPFPLWGDAMWCGQEVAQEATHKQAIRQLFPDPIPERGADLNTVADLVPESRNRFAPRSIAVRVDGIVVGYLPRDDAHRYYTVLSELVRQRLQPQVPCFLWASEWRPADEEDDGEFHASVAVALGQPHMLVPVNLPPPGTYHLLPPGSGIVVPGTELHQDVLAPYFRPEGECWAYATMHAAEEEGGLPDRPRTIVEIRLDGELVGRLRPRLSADFLPAVHYLADCRAETAVRVAIRGDHEASEVILYAARSHELPATWPEQLTESRQRAFVATPGWYYESGA